ncbi:hypothetical protein AB0D04_30995 [Streptomyces sp. NPDC048483]|uniref:hypothetical protein n=1 Tax=Streptomyces sp. NPDC048483 TaxID=3154927 RepID=UPI00342B4DB7
MRRTPAAVLGAAALLAALATPASANPRPQGEEQTDESVMLPVGDFVYELGEGVGLWRDNSVGAGPAKMSEPHRRSAAK